MAQFEKTQRRRNGASVIPTQALLRQARDRRRHLRPGIGRTSIYDRGELDGSGEFRQRIVLEHTTRRTKTSVTVITDRTISQALDLIQIEAHFQGPIEHSVNDALIDATKPEITYPDGGLKIGKSSPGVWLTIPNFLHLCIGISRSMRVWLLISGISSMMIHKNQSVLASAAQQRGEQLQVEKYIAFQKKPYCAQILSSLISDEYFVNSEGDDNSCEVTSDIELSNSAKFASQRLY